MKKERTFRNITLKYIKIAILIYIIFSFSYLIFIYISEKSQEQNRLESSIDRCSNYLENILNNVSSTNYILFSDQAINRIMNSPLTVDKYDFVEAMNTINRQVNNSDIISSIYLYHERAELVLSSNEGKIKLANFRDREFLENLNLIITPTIIPRKVKGKLTITIATQWPISSLNTKRYICINLDSFELSKQFSKLLNSEYSLEAKINNDSFFTYDPQNLISENDQDFISKKTLSQFNISITLRRSKKNFYINLINSFLRESLLFILITALLSLVFSLTLDSLGKVFRPMVFQLAALYREKESWQNYTFNDMKKDFEKLITERQVLFNRVDGMKRLVEDKVITDILRGVISDTDKIQKLCSSLGITNKGSQQDCYLVGCISIYGKTSEINAKDEVLSKVLIKNILMENNDKDIFIHAVVESEENIGILVNYPSSISPQDIEKLMEQNIAKIEESFSDSPDIGFFVSMVNPINSIGEICRAYNKAKANLVYRYVFLNKNHIIDSLNNDETSILMSHVDAQMIKFAASTDEFTIVHDYIKKLAKQYKENPTLEEFYRLKLKTIMGACIILDQAYLSNNLGVQKKLFSDLEQLFQAESEEDIITAFIHLTSDISNQIISHIPKSELENDYLHKAFSFIEANYDKGISISDIANYLNLNPKYLARLFKKETGQTMSQYISELRLKKAVSLLNRTDLSIQEISKQIGFNDCRSFIRLFKKAFDITPGEYKASRR